MASDTTELQHAALWLIGPDMPGLLKLGARFVADRGGNINKDIADKFGEKAVVFMSISAAPDDIARMEREKEKLEFASGVGVVFQPMNEPTVPEGFQDGLYGFDVITDDAPGLVAKLTRLAEEFGLLLVGHTGELRVVPGLTPLVQAGQKFVVMLPEEFDHHGFTEKLNSLVEEHNGVVQTPLRPVLGLLWW
ncbi:MAG: hypothetical protein IIC02_00455 [Planctomycetes bacterium]|nr:hypothetical protein [Planctomycetota bacterium]